MLIVSNNLQKCTHCVVSSCLPDAQVQFVALLLPIPLALAFLSLSPSLSSWPSFSFTHSRILSLSLTHSLTHNQLVSMFVRLMAIVWLSF